MAFTGARKVWMNGTLVDWADANIHVASHGVHYGSGVFEGARCYRTPKGSACFRLDAHMRPWWGQRSSASASALGATG